MGLQNWQVCCWRPEEETLSFWVQFGCAQGSILIKNLAHFTPSTCSSALLSQNTDSIILPLQPTMWSKWDYVSHSKTRLKSLLSDVFNIFYVTKKSKTSKAQTHIVRGCTLNEYVSLSQENCTTAILIIITSAQGGACVFCHLGIWIIFSIQKFLSVVLEDKMLYWWWWWWCFYILFHKQKEPEPKQPSSCPKLALWEILRSQRNSVSWN